MVKSYPVEDPAYRDVDGEAWRRDRFAERVRRAWNTVHTVDIESAGGDVDVLADLIHKRVGGQREEIVHRLTRFKAMERDGAGPADDPLVRPGQW